MANSWGLCTHIFGYTKKKKKKKPPLPNYNELH